MKNIAVINACSDLGVHIDGAKLAPEIITRDIDLANKYTLKVEDYEKDLDKGNKAKNLIGINKFNKMVYEKAKELIKNDFLPLTVGGDHSIAIATALASIDKYKNMGIIWFDSHGDFNTFDTTMSGNIHGLPLAVITNYEKKDLNNFHNGNYYSCKNAVIVGARDIDTLEKINIEKSGVTVFTTEDIKKQGIHEVCKKAFEIALNGTNGVHISYDIDLIDPKIAPGVSIPAINGIDLDDAYAIINEILSHKEDVKSVDIVEFNPLKDNDNITENITKTIFGKLYDNLLKKQ